MFKIQSYDRYFGIAGEAFFKTFLGALSPAVSASLTSPLIWHCDECMQPIQNADEGRLEWVRYPSSGGRDIRIVHAGDCQRGTEGTQYNRGYVMNLGLWHFLGREGLDCLLDLLLGGDFALKPDGLEIFKRLHVPGYQESLNRMAGIYDAAPKPVIDWLDDDDGE